MMKNYYFDSEKIDEQAESLQHEIFSAVNERKYSLKRAKCALLVVDMQQFFLDENSHAFTPTGLVVKENIIKLVKICKEKGMPVIFSRHINDEKNAGMMDKWWDDIITEENPLSELDEDLPTENCKIIIKSQYDVFYGTDFEQYLKSQGIEQLIICGVLTHLCCETSARSAFVHGFEVFFPVDGSASYNLEFHKASLMNLAHGFAHIPTVSQLLNRINKFRN